MQLSKILRTAMVAWLALSACAFAAEPKRSVGVFGDSLGDGLWSGLYTATKSNANVQLFRHSKIGAGFTRPDYTSWFNDFVASLDESKLTDAVIMVGANDRQGIRDENRKGYLFQSEGWRRTYAARVDAILGELAKRHVSVIWVGLPVMRSEELNTGAQYLNEIFQDAARRNGATYLSLAESFKGEDGSFTAYQPDKSGHLRQIRAEDGVHFTGYGYEQLAAKIYAALSAPSTVQTASTTPASTTPTSTTPASVASANAAAAEAALGVTAVAAASPLPSPLSSPLPTAAALSSSGTLPAGILP